MTDQPADPALLARLSGLRDRVAAAAADSSRSPGTVRILLATKTVAPEVIAVALAAGFTLIGENRVQEVVDKAPALAAWHPQTHFIGHLQSNKIGQLLPLVSCVQTVDSASIAGRLDARCAAAARVLDVLVQVNVSGEDSKFGVTVARAPELAEEIVGRANLRLCGYMTIGLNSPDLPAVRAGYSELADLRDRLLARPGFGSATELSMGMSADYPTAIAAGATIVRIGSGAFGARPRPVV